MKANKPEVIWDRYIPEPNSGCWIWDWCCDEDGYGLVAISGKLERATRISYQLIKGPIPSGLFVCHKCDMPSCINPSHLFLGTPKQNSRDMCNKNRQTKGQEIGQAKLTDSQVLEIRTIYNKRQMGSYRLSKKFGVDKSIILDILHGRIWRHVGGLPVKIRQSSLPPVSGKASGC